MKKYRHILEYASLEVFSRLVRLLPLAAARFIARRMADLVYFVIPIRKKLVIASLTEAFGKEKSAAEIKRIARKVYHQFAQTAIELIFFPKLSGDDLKKLVKIENTDVLDAARAQGKGAVLVGAHFGNWEYMGAALAQYYPVSFVVGAQQNKRVDDLLNSYRAGKNVGLIPLKMSLRGVMRALKNNEFIAILSDQDAHEDGAFVPFFGKPASTPRGAALFALRSGSPLIMGTIFRENERFRVVFESVPKPESSGNEDLDVVNYTAAFTKILEDHARARPDHWLWLHRRWKTKKKNITLLDN